MVFDTTMVATTNAIAPSPREKKRLLGFKTWFCWNNEEHINHFPVL